MINWNGLKGSDHDLIEVLPQNLPGGTEEIANISAQVQTDHFQEY
jgi:hypothetical protein